MVHAASVLAKCFLTDFFFKNETNVTGKAVEPQSNELTRGTTELVQHFRL